MVLFSASSAAASFALEGRLNAPYAAAFSAACAVAAYLGVSLVRALHLLAAPLQQRCPGGPGGGTLRCAQAGCRWRPAPAPQVGAAVNRSGRASLVAVLLTAIIGTGCLLTAVYSGADALAELRASL